MRLPRVKNIAALAFKARKCMPLSIEVSHPAVTKGKPQLSSPFATKSLTLWELNVPHMGHSIHPDSSLTT